MANYFTLEYENTANTSPGNVELNYGSPTSDGLAVHVSLYAGSGFTPTHYKMWGLELVSGEGIVTVSGAEWIPYSNSVTAYLARHNDPQSADVKFKDASTAETSTFTSNEVTFTFVDPIITGDVAWTTDFEELGFDSATSNVIRKTAAKTDIELNKNKVEQLSFSGRDFTGLRVGDNTVYVDPESEIGQVIALDEASYLSISKQFDTDDVPMITVSDGTGFNTLTAYDRTVKTTVSGTDADRIDNISWTSGTKTLTFDVYSFSTYGFCTVQKVEFTTDSETGAYVGGSATFTVYVEDTNWEPVENAPVTISGVSGDIGDIQGSMTVDTNANGLAVFTLDVDTAGTVIYSAHVDNTFVDDNIIIRGITPTDNQRSLLTQYEQIHRTGEYRDDVAGVNTQAVAEPSTPTVSGSSDSVLEHDLNVLRTLIKQIKSTSVSHDWFAAVDNYLDPTDTDGVDVANKLTNLDNIKGNTLDSKTIILAVNESNAGAGYSLTPGDEGFLFDTALGYALPNDRRGLPIYESTTNSGTYWDEGADDRVVGIDIIDMDTGGEFISAGGDTVFARFHDGADAPTGSGVGQNVYVKFYTEAGPYTTVSGDPTSVLMIHPYRKVMSDVEEYEWHRTDYVSSWEGDEILVGYVSNQWAYTGASDNETDPDWSPVAGLPLVTSSITSLKDALDAINTGVGSDTYTGTTYLSSGDSITDALSTLDSSLYTMSQSVAAGLTDTYIQEVVADIPAGTAQTLPVGVTYTANAEVGRQGSNMDVFLNGQLLSACTGVGGVNEDRDYMETNSTQITFTFDVYQYSNITYKIRT